MAVPQKPGCFGGIGLQTGQASIEIGGHGQGQGIPGATPYRPDKYDEWIDRGLADILQKEEVVSDAVSQARRDQEREKTFAGPLIVNINNISGALEGLAERLKEEKIATFDDAMDTVYASMREIMISKQKLRGPGNITSQGLYGIFTRVKDDKLERIMKSVKRDVQREQCLKDGMPVEVVDQYYPAREVVEANLEKGDSLEDDIIDCANYCIIALMVMRGIWGFPVAK